MRYPNVGANRIRVEAHLLPAVSTGPQDPEWSPDGNWLAFSMSGDIWKVPSNGGTAVALTNGSGYHFEPAWRPDGRSIALTVDLDGNLDIAVVAVDGGQITRITNDAHVDIQSACSPDGKGLYFVSARNGSFDIYCRDVPYGAIQPVVTGRGHQIQPAPSPDGTTLAYIDRVPERLGNGGIWSKSLDTGETTLVHYEETSFRTKPIWTPDGTTILFVSDEAASNDIASVPSSGGSKARLTEDSMHEFSPAISSDGTTLAFVSNQDGPTRLFTMPAGGARKAGWKEVVISKRQARDPVGSLTVRVLGPDGRPFPSRIYLKASDGRAYTPDGGFHRVISSTETHYFHTAGEFTVRLPVGEASVEAMRGFEYLPASTKVIIKEGETAELTLRLETLLDASARGWYSGETHAHDLHQGRFGLSHEAFFRQLLAEDLRVTNALIHMDGTRIMGRWDDLTGEPHPLSTADYILQYGQEFRGSFGHVGLLGVKEFIMPLIGGTPWTAFSADVLNYPYLDAARVQGGIGGFMHPYSRPVKKPEDGASSEIPLDVALGKGDFYDVLCIWYDELGNAEMYYRLLNAGFRIAATAGSDPFPDVWRDPPPGTTRTYARIERALSVPSWLDAVKNAATFGTSGPLLFATVDGRMPGEELRRDAGGPTAYKVEIEVASIVPVDKVEVVINGKVAKTFGARQKKRRFRFSDSVELEGSGWIAFRAIGPSHRYVSDSYAFAHTSPVYIVRNGKRFTSASDARFLAEVVQAMWKRVEQRDRWKSESGKEAYKQAAEKATKVYLNIAADAEKSP
jgi:Tol biopolymer transport system component